MNTEKFTVHDDMFGAYVKIPTGANRDMHVYKVIGRINSNGYSDVPIIEPAKSVRHNEIVPVLNVVHCGVSEDTVIRVPLSECEIVKEPNEPLTKGELQRMDGDPVWCKEYEIWGIVEVESSGQWALIPFFCAHKEGVPIALDIEKRHLTIYRRPLKED